MHHLSSIGGVAILKTLEDGLRRTRALETLDARHDVDHGFGVQAWYRRAPDVFNRAGDQPGADRIEKKLAFSVECAWPSLIVLNDSYRGIAGHALSGRNPVTVSAF